MCWNGLKLWRLILPEGTRQSNEPLLKVDNLVTGYGKKQVVNWVSIGVAIG